jgi:hypothetical protein
MCMPACRKQVFTDVCLSYAVGLQSGCTFGMFRLTEVVVQVTFLMAAVGRLV